MRYLKIILIILIIVTGFTRIFLGAFTVTASSIESASLMEKVNRERQNRNIPPLFVTEKLNSAATAKTNDMFARDYFDHVDPDGSYVWPLISAAGYGPYKLLGENLAIDFSSEDGIVRAWLNSPSHRNNMLNSEFADQGMSARFGDFETRYTSLVTNLFGTLITIIKPDPVAESQPTPAAQPPAPDPPTTEPVPTPLPQPVPAPQIVEEPVTQSVIRANAKPAIQLKSLPQDADSVAQDKQSFSITVPTQIQKQDADVLTIIRTIFIILTILLIITIFIDLLTHKKGSSILNPNTHLPLLLLLLFVSIMTLNLY